MDREPKKLITRILEFSALFALAAFLLRLAICYLQQIWVPLTIIGAVLIVIVIVYRIWKNNVLW